MDETYSVSYTHLDVYKRQLSYCSAAFFISFVIHAAKVSALARATKQTLFFSAEAAPVSPPAAEEALSAATEPPAGALPAALEMCIRDRIQAALFC